MLDIHEQQLRKACQQVSSLVSAGNRRVVETVLRQYVELSQDPEQVMELVFSEFVAREEGGEQPDRAEYFERFPDLRERLERLFKIHQTLGHENATGAETTAASDTGVSASSKTKLQRAGISKKVGDYEILGEVGRGGMGVVYKARHRTLGRLVALKEIKSNFVEEDQRERLFREASAAARLQHPHVVQIFEVGEGANGPFLSMELISGGSLETRIAENAYDAKDAANILKTLAETMQYAHQNGVIHRDLKPANVLVGDDNHIKLTDFGLAKILEIARQTQEDELSLTQSGAILGTPCYMAPEQVDGKKADVGVATDIYALGAILYELLTGRPPFRGDSPLETFQLIQSSSPVAPRRFRPMLNRDLETICLKCLEKDPWRRYASAAELAEDLSRFLDSQPILARPIGGIERTWRWCKRKPLVTGLGIALGLSLAFGFMAVTSQWMRAEHQKRLAQDNARNTELQRNEAEKQKNQAQYERNRAMREKNRSELNFETAKNVIDRFTRIGETFTRVPQTEQSGRQLLKESLQFYNALLQLESADPLAKFQTALAHYRAARIHQELRQWRESHQTISQAIDLLTELCDDFPSQQDYRLHLTHAYFRYADGSRRAGQNELAEKVFGETMEQCDRFLELFPNDDNLKVIRAIALINGLTVARYGSLEKHANDLKKAIVVLDRVSRVSPLATWIRQNQALGTECLAIAQWQNENRPEAAQSFRNAIAIRTQLAKATGSRQVASQPRILIKPTLLNVDPSMKSTEISSADRVDLHKIENEPVRIDPLIVSAEENLFYQARNHKLLGLVFSELGHGDDAEEHFRFAVTVADDLRAISNSSFHHRILLATSQAELARILMTQSRVDESIDVFSVAAKRYRDLSRGWRKGTAELGESPYLFLQPDRVIASGEKAKTAAKICLEAIEFLDALSDATPSDPHRRNDLARALKLVVPLTRKISSFAHGEKILRNAAALHQQLIEQFPDEPEYRMGLADDYSDLAAHFWRQTELNKAIESYRKAVDIQVEILQQDSKNAQAISSLKTVRRQLAALLNEIGETGDAIQVYRAAIELDPDSAQPHNDLAWQLVTCSDRFHDPAEAVRLAERAVELAPNNATYLNTLGAAHYRAQNFEFAVKNLHQAIANHWGRPTVLDLTVLSLCEYGRGNHQMARQYLSESERWLAWHQNWDPIAEHDRKDIEVFLRSARKALPQVEAVDVLQQKLGKSGVIYLGDQQLFAAATVSGGKIQLQNMAQFGPTWSDDSQLWWHENRTRMRLKLRVEVEREGDYSIFGRFTKANDYGRFQFHVNGQKLGDPIECFNAGPYRFAVINSGRIKLGRAHLPAGRNQFELEIEGKARDSSQYMVGIDDLELVRVR